MDSLRAPMQKFAMSLFQAYRKQQPDGNLLYSPMIASTGLLLILMGAEGETRDEIETAMKFDDSPLFTTATFEEDLKMAYRYTLAVISKARATEDNLFRVFRVNKLFVDSNVELNENFMEQVRKLKGEIFPINFKENPDAARDEIERYIETGLNGKFGKSFVSGEIDEETRMVLVNGICFKARWDVTFDLERTTTQPFHQMDAAPADVPMMHATLQLPYVQEPEVGVTYVEIPYINNILSLLIFLPMMKGGLKEMVKKLNPAIVNRINLIKRMREVNISLPRFKLTTQLDMKALFRKVGVRSMISENANLSRMTNDTKPFYLSAAIHNAFFSVNEKGTDADDCVDSGIKLSHTNGPSSFSAEKKVKRTASLDAAKYPNIPVVVDQPFLFAVRHNKSGIMIFLGRVEHIE